MDKIDYKKDFKDLYLPKNQAMIIEVPKMKFIVVEGKGNPNISIEYKNALELLYGLSYTLKMSKKGNYQIPHYCEYTVFPLEGLWWTAAGQFDLKAKEKLSWYAMIRQPDFITEENYRWALQQYTKKKGPRDFSSVAFWEFAEGLCVQMLHLGSYDDEPKSFDTMAKFVTEKGYEKNADNKWHHHEIYLSDPRKVSPENNKTVLRYSIKKR